MSVWLDVEDVNCRMSRYSIRESTGIPETMYTGSMMWSGLRHLRSYCMEMLNLRRLMLSCRLGFREISIDFNGRNNSGYTEGISIHTKCQCFPLARDQVLHVIMW